MSTNRQERSGPEPQAGALYRIWDALTDGRTEQRLREGLLLDPPETMRRWPWLARLMR